MLSIHIHYQGNTYHWSVCEDLVGVAIARGVREHFHYEECLAEAERVVREAGAAEIVDER